LKLFSELVLYCKICDISKAAGRLNREKQMHD
jgi:hypothetical protein